MRASVKQSRIWNRVLMLQTQALRVGQVKKPCIGLTQENSIESSVQDSLPYILIYYYSWSMLTTVHPTLNDHVYDMRPTGVVHVV